MVNAASVSAASSGDSGLIKGSLNNGAACPRNLVLVLLVIEADLVLLDDNNPVSRPRRGVGVGGRTTDVAATNVVDVGAADDGAAAGLGVLSLLLRYLTRSLRIRW